jgi:tetrapyrrole methylase family protein / MazG family protein
MKVISLSGDRSEGGRRLSKEEFAHQVIDSMHAESEPKDEYRLPTTDKCDIRIVGLGMRSVDQLTREAQRAIAGTKTIYVVDSSPGIQSFFRKMGLEVIDLSKHYEEGKDRLQTYLEMSKEVISGAIHKGPVSFGLYGHPTVFAYPPFVIKAVAESCGLTVGVVPGVSALDCMLAELMLDPATDGMQMFEATDIVIRKRTLLTDVHTLIWQIGALETGLYSRQVSVKGRFDRFLQHIVGFFPTHHPVAAIFVSDNPLIPSIIYRFKLKDLPDYGDRLHGGFTLHIPPLSTAAVLDFEALELLKSKEHLNAITRKDEGE